MDGSAAPFVFLIECAGVVEQCAPRNVIEVLKPIRLGDENRWIGVTPAETFSLRCDIDFDHPALGHQSVVFDPLCTSFRTELARARTFCRESDVEGILAAGMGRGGSLERHRGDRRRRPPQRGRASLSGRVRAAQGARLHRRSLSRRRPDPRPRPLPALRARAQPWAPLGSAGRPPCLAAHRGGAGAGSRAGCRHRLIPRRLQSGAAPAHTDTVGTGRSGQRHASHEPCRAPWRRRRVGEGAVRAWELGIRQGSVDSLRLVERPEPEPAAGEALVRIRASALNYRDHMILNLIDSAPKPAQRIPLSDGAGEVVAVGAGVDSVEPGDRVTVSLFTGWLDGPLQARALRLRPRRRLRRHARRACRLPGIVPGAHPGFAERRGGRLPALRRTHGLGLAGRVRADEGGRHGAAARYRRGFRIRPSDRADDGSRCGHHLVERREARAGPRTRRRPRRQLPARSGLGQDRRRADRRRRPHHRDRRRSHARAKHGCRGLQRAHRADRHAGRGREPERPTGPHLEEHPSQGHPRGKPARPSKR